MVGFFLYGVYMVFFGFVLFVFDGTMLLSMSIFMKWCVISGFFIMLIMSVILFFGIMLLFVNSKSEKIMFWGMCMFTGVYICWKMSYSGILFYDVFYISDYGYYFFDEVCNNFFIFKLMSSTVVGSVSSGIFFSDFFYYFLWI